MMKGMSPDQLKVLMEQAKDSKKILEDQVRELVEQEVKRRGLMTREEVLRLLGRS